MIRSFFLLIYLMSTVGFAGVNVDFPVGLTSLKNQKMTESFTINSGIRYMF